MQCICNENKKIDTKTIAILLLNGGINKNNKDKIRNNTIAISATTAYLFEKIQIMPGLLF